MVYNQSIPVPVYTVPMPQYAQIPTAPPQPQSPAQPIEYIQPAQVYAMQTAPTQFGRNSTRTICPACHAHIMTKVEYNISQKTHLIAMIMCLFTGCCCIPYCFNTCKTPCHYCPNCNTFLGVYDEDTC